MEKNTRDQNVDFTSYEISYETIYILHPKRKPQMLKLENTYVNMDKKIKFTLKRIKDQIII